MTDNSSKKFQRWSESNMECAVSAVLNGAMGYLKSSKAFNVPQSTLERRVKKARKLKKSAAEVSKKGLGRQAIFSPDQEKELVNLILLMESRMFGLTLTDVRRLAYEFAEMKNIKHTFNKSTQMTGKEWLYSFLFRNPSVSLRTHDNSMARAACFTKLSVNNFFNLLEEMYRKFNFTPDRIFNVDETRVLISPNNDSQILGLTRKQQIEDIVSTESSSLTTTIVCMNAAGNFMPPMFIFPRVEPNIDLLEGSPPGSTCEFHPSGWIQTDIFLKWFHQFLDFTKPTENKPAMLILDGHATHVKNLAVIEAAQNNHVIVLCLPPHCSHHLQPLYVSFMKPLSSFYSDEVEMWLRDHRRQRITLRQIGQLFGAGFLKAATVETAINGFNMTGIYPFNRALFTDPEFGAIITTEILEPSMTIAASSDQAVPGPSSTEKIKTSPVGRKRIRKRRGANTTKSSNKKPVTSVDN